MSSETPSGKPQGGSRTIMMLVGVVIVAALAYFGVQYYNNQSEMAAQTEMAEAEAAKAADMAKEAAATAEAEAAKAAEMAKEAAAAAEAEAAKVAEAAAAAAAKPSASPAIIYDLGGKFDKSFNEAGYIGATTWSEKTGVPFLDLELQNDAQREQALRQFARRGANPIVIPGFSWGAALEKVAPEFPDTHFAIIDMVVDAPNVRSVVFDEHTGSFLVGALAALKSETGKVGFVGGMDIPLIHKFYCGYAQGAKAVNPDVEVYENYTGTTPAAWNDPVTASELAKASFNRGADVVFAAAGGSGIGVLQAAADEGKYSIGVDSNQNYIQPGSVLTSMVKRVDVAVAAAFQDEMDGNWTSGFQVMGLGNDGVAFALDEFNKDLITDDMLAKVQELSAKIQAGEIVVHDYTSDGTCPV